VAPSSDLSLLAFSCKQKVNIMHFTVPTGYETIANRRSDTIRHRCYNSTCTDAENMLKWANEWVEKCSKDHKLCQNQFVASSQKDYLPLRLLDVQDGVADAVQLVSMSQFEPGSTSPYCALSHCWGGTVDFKLTRNELDQMQSLRMNLLPRNFQHAIAITR
jgi:hypothetical protein